MDPLSDPPENASADVIVVTYNSGGVLPGMLDSLVGGMRGLVWDLVIVDNASADDTPGIAAAAGAGIVQMGTNAGFAAAANRGLADTDPSRDVLVLNPDVRLAPGSAARMQARLGRAAAATGDPNQRPRVGIVVPRLVDSRGNLLFTLRFEPSVSRALAEAAIGVRLSGRLGLSETVLDRAAYYRPSTAAWASGAALMISRECLDRCGRFDESFFLYSEDAEYALRAGERGYATELAPDAVATHLGGSSRVDPDLWTLLVQNKVELHRRRHGAPRALAFRIASVLRELRFALSGNPTSGRAAMALLRRRRSTR